MSNLDGSPSVEAENAFARIRTGDDLYLLT